MYINVRDGLSSKPKLIPVTSKLEEVIKNTGRDWYVSLYHYNEAHKKLLEEKGTLAGVTDTITNKLFFDFDSKDNLELARADTIETANRLVSKGFPEESINCFFTGSKGFNIEVAIDQYITPEQFGLIVDKISGDLSTFDTVVREANRIVRVSGTKHQTTGLYKIPLTAEELVDMDIEDIKKMAKKRREIETEVVIASLPEELKLLKPVEKALNQIRTELSFDIASIDMKERPKGIDEARWLLSNGFFKAGERNPAMLCLAATYHNQKFPFEVTKGILEGVAEIQSSRTGDDIFEEREINLILNQVYGSNWKGGTFTTRDPNNWLAKYAKKMGIETNKLIDNPMQITDVSAEFKHFVENYDQNLVETGIPFIDKEMPLTIGTNAAILGSPGSGKTTLALNILKNCSAKNMTTVFFSLDMHRKRMFEKVMYDVTGLTRADLYQAYKDGKGNELVSMMKMQYNNVWFYDRSGTTPADMAAYIKKVEDHTETKVKLVMIDYLERVGTEKTSDTEASKDIAQKIQDLVMDLDIACITLVQPAKHAYSAGPDSPLENMAAIKGSSYLQQSYRNIISLWRPGFNPTLGQYDKFMELAILKNDLGSLGKTVMKFDGAKGRILQMEDSDHEDYKALMYLKKTMANPDKNDGWD